MMTFKQYLSFWSIEIENLNEDTIRNNAARLWNAIILNKYIY